MALNGKTAILSGAGAGIGAATARRFSQEGANLALIDLDEEALANTERDCRKGEGGLLTVCDDASNPNAMDSLIAETIARFGQIDILVNNAVYRVHKPFLEITHEEFQRSLEVNVTAYYFFAQKVVPHMIEAGGGSIINLSSTFGFVGSPGLSPYCISKGAVANMTRTLALELAENNIRVNAVAPGPIETEGMRALIEKDPKVLEMRLADVPFHRLGKPEEIARVCLFLAGDASSFVSGHNLVADGGFLTH